MEMLIFTTSVHTRQQAQRVAPLLNILAGEGNWNFALDDADKILRVLTSRKMAGTVERMMQQSGFACRELTDTDENLKERHTKN